MTTKTVFYSIAGHSRTVAQGVALALNGPLFGLTDRFSARPPGWKRAANRAVRGFDLALLTTPDVSFEGGDRLVLVFPYWNGAMVPAVSGFVRSVDLTGVTVFLVMTRHLKGGDELILQLEDDIVRQGGWIGDTFSLRTLWRKPQRLAWLGSRVGRLIAREARDGTALSLEELLEDVIEDVAEIRDRYLQLVEITPNRRLKAIFQSLAADEVAHMQRLQQLYRTYAGIVHELRRQAITPLKPEQMLNYSALLQGLGANVEAEEKALMVCESIAKRYPSQSDVVHEMAVLSQSSLKRGKRMRRLYAKLSRHRSAR